MFYKVVLTMESSKSTINRGVSDFVKLPYLVNNFLMRYPDDFGQNIKVVALGAWHIIFKDEVSVTDSF